MIDFRSGSQTPSLRLKMKSGRASCFIPIVRKGCLIAISPGSTLKEVLLSAGFAPEYLESRVETVFLNGIAADDMESKVVKEGSVIALSAAMPGLAGAIFRKKSPVSTLRSRIEGTLGNDCGRRADEMVCLKLFNMVAEEMGPRLLRSGVILKACDLVEFFANRRDLLENAISEARLDGTTMDTDSLFGMEFPGSEHIFLSVELEMAEIAGQSTTCPGE